MIPLSGDNPQRMLITDKHGSRVRIRKKQHVRTPILIIIDTKRGSTSSVHMIMAAKTVIVAKISSRISYSKS